MAPALLNALSAAPAVAAAGSRRQRVQARACPLGIASRPEGDFSSLRAQRKAVQGLSASTRSRGDVSVRALRRLNVSAAAATMETPAAKLPARNEDTTVLVVGPTGYIGRFVTKELISRGYKVVVFSREKAGIKGAKGKEDVIADFPGAYKVLFGEVKSTESLRSVAFAEKIDVVVSCLASRTGGIQDSWDIDYQATLNCLEEGRRQGAKHFVLLSAICVQKPLLEFQKAKLKFEAALQEAGDITYSIVRPTAFMKSLAGQVPVVQQGGPYVMFGDGFLASCKPISESDLAKYMADCIRDPKLWNQVLPIGGPGKALSAKEQGDMLFEITGKEPKFISAPVWLFDAIIGFLDFLASLFPNLKDTAEFGRIGKYYAVESMLVMDPKTGKYLADETPSYGTDTLRAFFEKVAKEGMAGQELGDAAVFGQK